MNVNNIMFINKQPKHKCCKKSSRLFFYLSAFYSICYGSQLLFQFYYHSFRGEKWEMHLHNFLKCLKELEQTALRHFLELSSLSSLFFCRQMSTSSRKSEREINCHTKYCHKEYFRFQLSCVCLSLSPVFLLHGPITKKKLLLKLQTGGRIKFKRIAAGWKTSL